MTIHISLRSYEFYSIPALLLYRLSDVLTLRLQPKAEKGIPIFLPLQIFKILPFDQVPCAYKGHINDISLGPPQFI